ncbi:MAG: hydroxypyruvate isomerase family protein [Planctomycetota bacterium]
MTTPNQSSDMTRRTFGLGALGTTASAAMLAGAAIGSGERIAVEAADAVTSSQGRLKQSMCKWCYDRKLSLDELCVIAKDLGMAGIDLLTPKEFDTVKKHGLVCTMVSSHPLSEGLCDPKYWDKSLAILNETIEATSAAGFRNVITFSGNARGIDRKTGLKNCAEALKKIVPVAEKKNIILNMELLNSRVDHGDYMCDLSAWGVELCKEVGSDHFKLLFDIYHMQIMEGDIIRTIQRDHEYFGHYHTGGNPGRHEIDDSQELYYPAIAKAIADTGFDGYFAHEFIPVQDVRVGLTEAVKRCTV